MIIIIFTQLLNMRCDHNDEELMKLHAHVLVPLSTIQTVHTIKYNNILYLVP